MPAEDSPLTSDEDLLRQTAAGDHTAFSLFVERHQAAVFRHASYLLARREDAEDVLQETFLSAMRAAGQFRQEASARTWLFRIARNAALRRLHPVSQPAGDDTLETLAVRAGWGVANPESLAMLAQDRQRLNGALASLTHEEREVLLLREWEGLPGEEAAALLHLSLPALKSRLHRARLRLAALLRSGKQEASSL